MGKAKPSTRPIWRGVISLGLVNVPVKLYPMIKESEVGFRFLRKGDGCPLKYERVCSTDEEVVPWSEVVRGFEVSKNEYVTFTKEELEAVKPESDKRVKIDKFVSYLDADPIYFETSYILTPDKSPEAYSLLYNVFEKKGMAGLGKFTLRTKEYPALIHAYKSSIVLTTLRYNEEVVDPQLVEELQELKEPSEKELEMAFKIVENLSGKFDMEDYRDTYRERIEELVKKKLKGETIKVERPPTVEEARSLMDALQATLRQLDKK